MDGPDRSQPRPTAGDEAVLESLIARCLDQLEDADRCSINDICADHPDLADRVRDRMRKLHELGIVSLADDDTALRPDPATSEQIDTYEMVRVLGSGGMGDVWLAHQTEPVRRDVALKVIKRGMDSEQVVRRFESERQALAMLDHEGIAKVFDAGCTDSGRPYFAMEFVDGVPITDYCDQHQLSTEDRLELFAMTCDAVHHAHQKGIIHRDLKPSNIMVREQDGAAVPKVIDFGLAKAVDQRLTEVTLFTELGQILGTPEYMSPEQADLSTTGVDTRTDVYSLGVVLYELLVGSLPFSSEHLRSGGLTELHRIIKEEEAGRPSARISSLGADEADVAHHRGSDGLQALSRRVSGDLDWITLKAIAKDRERRYASVSELAADVRRHLRHEPVLAGPPTLSYRLSKFVRRYRGAVATGATVFALIVVGLLVLAFEYQRAERHLTHFDSLSDARRLDDYLVQAETQLWPAHPDRVQAMDSWLTQARDLAGTLPRHRETLEELRTAYGTTDGSGAWSFDQYRLRLLHDRLATLIDGLSALQVEGGPIARIETRRAWALSLGERSIEDHRAAWDRAQRDISDPSVCPPYVGELELSPQVGLVPLGRDRRSMLYEFAFLQPDDELPARDAAGDLVIKPASSIVLVLVPASSPVIGASLTPGDARHDPYAKSYEQPPRQAKLDAFFISKYELTQAQWQRLTGQNPSRFAHGGVVGRDIGPTHPVESVSWNDCSEWLRRLGLDLPTEAQWEYAARGGTESIWWSGALIEDVYGGDGLSSANLADLQCQLHSGAPLQAFDAEFDDGYVFHAPVDSLRPNGHGLHHVLGNVWEWCLDPAPDYSRCSPRDGDGLQDGPDSGRRSWRGGSFYSVAAHARSSTRLQGATNNKPAVVGVRPVRRLDR